MAEFHEPETAGFDGSLGEGGWEVWMRVRLYLARGHDDRSTPLMSSEMFAETDRDDRSARARSSEMFAETDRVHDNRSARAMLNGLIAEAEDDSMLGIPSANVFYQWPHFVPCLAELGHLHCNRVRLLTPPTPTEAGDAAVAETTQNVHAVSAPRLQDAAPETDQDQEQTRIRSQV